MPTEVRPKWSLQGPSERPGIPLVLRVVATTHRALDCSLNGQSSDNDDFRTLPLDKICPKYFYICLVTEETFGTPSERTWCRGTYRVPCSLARRRPSDPCCVRTVTRGRGPRTTVSPKSKILYYDFAYVVLSVSFRSKKDLILPVNRPPYIPL